MKEGMLALRRFISRHKMHVSVPVSLDPLYQLYDIRLVPFTPDTHGFSYHSVIALNASLEPYCRRMALAHEVAHRVLGHPNSLFLTKLSSWWYPRFEVEAQEGAALILVPLKSLLSVASDGATLREMQEQFEVPEELVSLRLRMARLTF